MAEWQHGPLPFLHSAIPPFFHSAIVTGANPIRADYSSSRLSVSIR
jgi:hypothetical protein